MADTHGAWYRTHYSDNGLRRATVVPITDDVAEHAVIVPLVSSNDDFGSEADQAEVWELEDRLAEAIDHGQVVEYDGNEIGDGEAVLYMYGARGRPVRRRRAGP